MRLVFPFSLLGLFVFCGGFAQNLPLGDLFPHAGFKQAQQLLIDTAHQQLIVVNPQNLGFFDLKSKLEVRSLETPEVAFQIVGINGNGPASLAFAGAAISPDGQQGVLYTKESLIYSWTPTQPLQIIGDLAHDPASSIFIAPDRTFTLVGTVSGKIMRYTSGKQKARILNVVDQQPIVHISQAGQDLMAVDLRGQVYQLNAKGNEVLDSWTQYQPNAQHLIRLPDGQYITATGNKLPKRAYPGLYSWTDGQRTDWFGRHFKKINQLLHLSGLRYAVGHDQGVTIYQGTDSLYTYTLAKGRAHHLAYDPVQQLLAVTTLSGNAIHWIDLRTFSLDNTTPNPSQALATAGFKASDGKLIAQATGTTSPRFLAAPAAPIQHLTQLITIETSADNAYELQVVESPEIEPLPLSNLPSQIAPRADRIVLEQDGRHLIHAVAPGWPLVGELPRDGLYNLLDEPGYFWKKGNYPQLNTLIVYSEAENYATTVQVARAEYLASHGKALWVLQGQQVQCYDITTGALLEKYDYDKGGTIQQLIVSDSLVMGITNIRRPDQHFHVWQRQNGQLIAQHPIKNNFDQLFFTPNPNIVGFTTQWGGISFRRWSDFSEFGLYFQPAGQKDDYLYIQADGRYDASPKLQGRYPLLNDLTLQPGLLTHTFHN